MKEIASGLSRWYEEIKDSASQDIQPISLLVTSTREELFTTESNTALSLQDQIKLQDGASREDIYPCTTMQEGLIALAVTKPESYVASFVNDLRNAPTLLDLYKLGSQLSVFVETCGQKLFPLMVFRFKWL